MMPDPPPSITTWTPPEKKPHYAKSYREGWDAYADTVQGAINNFIAAGSPDHPKIKELRLNLERANLEVEGWEQALVYENGLTEETRKILVLNVNGFKAKISSLPNTPAGSISPTTTS